jgi:predicted naringenin-chalcone synthase
MTILGIGSANPKDYIGQEEALASVLQLIDLDEKQQEHLKNLYTTSGIKKRHMVFSGDYFLSYLQTDPGMGSRNSFYRETAVNLATESSAKALATWGGNVADITHVISVSCTGVYAPGIEFSLIDRLKLNHNVLRLGINFMGCFGAFKGLQAARAFASQNSKNRILVVCTELCSLHFQKTNDLDSFLSGSIFADGSAAVVVGSDPRGTEQPLWEIKKEYCHALKDSEEQMTWEAADTGFRMKLSSYVPLNISHNIRPFVEYLMTDIDPSDCDYAIHPGGKSILQVLQRKLKLKEDQLDATHHIFSNFGNMSSATVLFVLEHLHKTHSKKPWCLGLGFGPGLSIEGFLLKKCT